jgi:hypothetical protein
VKIRSLLLVAAVVLLVPALTGLAAYFWLKRDILDKYDACVASLDEGQRRLPGLQSIVDDLKRVERFEGARWSLNATYDSGAINILVPASAAAEWHRRCGLSLTPADCLAAPREKFVICNAAFGRLLADPRLSSDIIRAEVRRPLRFLAQTFLGHELGHLNASFDNRVQHLFPSFRANGLRCTTRDRAKPTEEEAADDFGIDVACQATKLGDDEPIATDASSAIRTLTQLRNSLDDDFSFDDSCGGDDTYPSVSRRKSTFGFEYAKCMFPGKELPFAAVARDQKQAFEYLETWLRKRQVGGMVGSALYGNGPLYRYDVAGTVGDERFIAFDGTGKVSQISVTTRNGKLLDHSALVNWETQGELVDVRADAPTADFLVSFSKDDGTTDVRHVVVTCTELSVGCRARQTRKDLPAGVELRNTRDHAIVEITGRRLRTYVSARDFVDDKTAMDVSFDVDVRSGSLLLDGRADRLVLAVRPEEKVASGFHRVAFVTQDGVRWSTFTTIPTGMNPVHAVGIHDRRLVLALQAPTGQWSSGTQVWVCSSAPLESPAASKSESDCDIYDPPQDASYSIGVANNDLSSLGIQLAKADFCQGIIIVRESGWLWLIDPETHRQDIVPGTGLVNCNRARDHALVYRMRRIDEVTLEFKDAKPRRSSISLVSKSSGGRTPRR